MHKNSTLFNSHRAPGRIFHNKENAFTDSTRKHVSGRKTQAMSNNKKNELKNLNSYITQIKPDSLNMAKNVFRNPLIGTSNINSLLNKHTTSSSSNRVKKKAQSSHSNEAKHNQKGSEIVLKYDSIYYMGKLEHAYKSYSTDHYPTVFRQHFKQTIQTITILSKMAHPSEEAISDKMILLDDIEENKKTIILDLDETLIHCNENQNDDFDVKVPVHFPTGEFIEAGINIRPYAKELLSELSKNFEVIVFTASHSCYANPVIDYLDPDENFISKRLFRDNCVQIAEGFYVKD